MPQYMLFGFVSDEVLIAVLLLLDCVLTFSSSEGGYTMRKHRSTALELFAATTGSGSMEPHEAHVAAT
jgi:hypothetical protein